MIRSNCYRKHAENDRDHGDDAENARHPSKKHTQHTQ
jgi:hypothetical protein